MMAAEQLLEREVTIGNTMGLHARPAAMLAKIANGYDAELTLQKLGPGTPSEEVNCGSFLELLMLAAGKGTRLRLRASGAEARAVFDSAVQLFQSKFGEE